jgi:predicted homoserine dehydrogenase-like protein
MATLSRLRLWAQDGGHARVAVVGAGFIGRGLVRQLELTPGMSPAVVVNRSVPNAVRALEQAGHDPAAITISRDPSELAEAVRRGRPAVTDSPAVLTELEDVDLVIEATGALAHGASVILDALASGKDVVSMNAELDATIGYLLHHEARERGRIYTIGDGDQPGVLLRQLDFVSLMGIEVVAAVNCKGNLDVHQNPDDSRPYAERDGTSVLMTTAFGDGTKMQIENAVVANLTGLAPDRLGMHGVQTTVERAAGDIAAVISQHGVVEYTLGGDFRGGVGVVGYGEGEMVQPYMRYGKLGDGPYYFYYRPYHLLHFEVPWTIADVVLDRSPLGAPVGAPVAEVVSVAKRDLKAGERIDGIGGYACYGHVDAVDRAAGLLPIGLSENLTLVADVPKDEPIPLEAIELDEDAAIVRLRREQDALVCRAAERELARPASN